MPKIQQRSSQAFLQLDEVVVHGFEESRAGAGEFRVFVVHTTIELTRTALAAASKLTRNLDARVTLLTAQIVPFPLPLDQPDIAPAFLARKLAAVAQEIEAPVEVRVVVARDRNFGLETAVSPRSLVVVATRKRWWRTAEENLARSLGNAGHSVALLRV